MDRISESEINRLVFQAIQKTSGKTAAMYWTGFKRGRELLVEGKNLEKL